MLCKVEGIEADMQETEKGRERQTEKIDKSAISSSWSRMAGSNEFQVGCLEETLEIRIKQKKQTCSHSTKYKC